MRAAAAVDVTVVAAKHTLCFGKTPSARRVAARWDKGARNLRPRAIPSSRQ